MSNNSSFTLCSSTDPTPASSQPHGKSARELEAELVALEQQLQAARDLEVVPVIADIHRLMNEWAVSLADIERHLGGRSATGRHRATYHRQSGGLHRSISLPKVPEETRMLVQRAIAALPDRRGLTKLAFMKRLLLAI